LGKDKDLTSPNTLKTEEDREKIDLVQKDEDIKKIDDQKLKSEGSEGEKDHFALVVEKGCNHLNWG